MENPFNEKEILARMQRAGERLVALGYAERCVVDDGTGRGHIVWTPAGSALKKELQKIFDLIGKGKGLSGEMEFVAFLNFLVDMENQQPSP